MCRKQTRSEVNLWYFHLLKAQLTKCRCLCDQVHSSTEQKQQQSVINPLLYALAYSTISCQKKLRQRNAHNTMTS